MRLTKTLVLTVGLVSAVAMVFTACSSPATSSTKSSATANTTASKATPASAPASTSAKAVLAQTNCPITGDPIDKTVFTEYKGQKVYFCCSRCIAKFNKDPQKYLTAMRAKQVKPGQAGSGTKGEKSNDMGKMKM